MKCVECKGSGVFDRIDYDEIPCPACDGSGELNECVSCGKLAWLLANENDESHWCGSAKCLMRIQRWAVLKTEQNSGSQG